MARTFLQARGEISRLLHERGWQLSPALKVPYATSPSGRLRLWFKAQAVYFTEASHGGRGGHHEFKNARTLSYDLDIRKITPEQFLAAVERWFPESARDIDWQLPHGLEFTPEERARMAKTERRARKLRALRMAQTERGAGHFQHPKFVRDPRRDHYVVPRGGATHGRDLRGFTTEVKALLFARGFGPYKVDQMVTSGKAWIWDAWRKGSPPCAVADQFAGRMRRDPKKKRGKKKERLEVVFRVDRDGNVFAISKPRGEVANIYTPHGWTEGSFHLNMLHSRMATKKEYTPLLRLMRNWNVIVRNP